MYHIHSTIPYVPCPCRLVPNYPTTNYIVNDVMAAATGRRRRRCGALTAEAELEGGRRGKEA